jgi:Mn-dependent DtxR family transcriptional regulator
MKLSKSGGEQLIRDRRAGVTVVEIARRMKVRKSSVYSVVGLWALKYANVELTKKEEETK